MKTKNNDKLVRLCMGGVTGSNPVASVRYLRDYEGGGVVARPLSRHVFGTNTTSIGILVGATGIIVDNGTGVGQVSEWLKAQGVTQVFILQTHYHIDHIAGIASNSFLLEKDIVRGLYGPKLGQYEFESAVRVLYGPPFYPISPSIFGIQHKYYSFDPGSTLPIMGGVKTLLMNYNGGSVGYRIPTPAGDVVIMSDSELDHPADREAAAEFMKGAMVAYVEIQYRDSEYAGAQVIGPGNTNQTRKNWGHSTPSMVEQTYQLMVEAPKLTLVGHHDPKRSDEDLFKFEKEVEHILSSLGTHVEFAQEHAVYNFPYIARPKQKSAALATA